MYILVPFSERARCEIRKKTDLGSGAEMIYVYRSYSPEMISRVAEQNSVDFQVMPTNEAYATVIFHQRRSLARSLFSRFGFGTLRR